MQAGRLTWGVEVTTSANATVVRRSLRRRRKARYPDEDGYAMVALLVAISIMAIALSVALPTWSTLAKREREEELVFRGEQYARAIALYQRRYANAFPPSIDVLVQQRFLRKRYRDPMMTDGEFQVILVGQPIPGQTTPPTVAQQGRAGAREGFGQRGGLNDTLPGERGRQPAPGRGTIGGTIGGGGLLGVVSKSTDTSIRLYNGRNKYSEWAFVATQATTQAGARGGGQTPGVNGPGRDGRGGRGGRFGIPQPNFPPFGRRGRGQ